jgi:hypothetical protein
MKVAIQYSGHLRFIRDTYPTLKELITSDENIEFYFFVHTWDESLQDDIDYMINVIKPSRYYVDKQKNFERHPYQLMNKKDIHDEYKYNRERIEWNDSHPNDIKYFFEKPSPENNYDFNKDLEVVKFNHYSHYPFNTLSLFYSIHQVGLLTNSYAQENNINFDFIIRLRSDLQLLSKINLQDKPNSNLIYVFDSINHPGEQGSYTINDQFAIGSQKLMTIYNDLFMYLPCYYHMFELDWISEILLGFHLKYNNIEVYKFPRYYKLLRYEDRNIDENSVIKRPTK